MRTIRMSTAVFCVLLSLFTGADEGRSAASSVTFAKDVAPILFKRCVECHRPGEVAPIKIKDQTIRLKRIINVVASHSFALTEEISIDDGPFQRLGNATASRVMDQAAKK